MNCQEKIRKNSIHIFFWQGGDEARHTQVTTWTSPPHARITEHAIICLPLFSGVVFGSTAKPNVRDAFHCVCCGSAHVWLMLSAFWNLKAPPVPTQRVSALKLLTDFHTFLSTRTISANPFPSFDSIILLNTSINKCVCLSFDWRMHFNSESLKCNILISI